MKQRFFGGVLTGLIGIILAAGAVSAAGMAGMNPGTDKAPTPAPAPASQTDPAADRKSFQSQWEEAFAAAALTPDQIAQLTRVLDGAAGKLAENDKAGADLIKQKDAAPGNHAATLQKRIDLQREERDFIVSNVEIALADFLNEDLTSLVLMAGFHGVSPQHSGATHQPMPGMSADPGGMGKAMNPFQQAAMDLGEAAGRLNANYQAVTLELIRDFLKMQAMK